jgi:dTDP-4-dehydrorhamnose reductase
VERPASALIVGADSLIGAALAVELQSRGTFVIGTSRRQSNAHLFLDLARPFDLSALPEASSVFLCAGINGFAACNEDPVTAATVNISATVLIGSYYLQRGAHVVFISSSAIFGARGDAPNEEDAPSPNTTYGAFKCATEIALLETAKIFGGECAVVRLTKVFVPSAAMLQKWRARGTEGRAIDAFVDAFISPVALNYVVYALLKVSNRRLAGRFHLAGAQTLSYADFASALVERRLIPATLINRTSQRSPEQATLSPQCAALAMPRTSTMAGVQPQPLDEFMVSIESQS